MRGLEQNFVLGGPKTLRDILNVVDAKTGRHVLASGVPAPSVPASGVLRKLPKSVDGLVRITRYTLARVPVARGCHMHADALGTQAA